MKEEVIELEIIWYGGQSSFCLDKNSSKINMRGSAAPLCRSAGTDADLLSGW